MLLYIRKYAYLLIHDYSFMFHNLYQLSVIFGSDDWRQKFEAMPSLMEVAETYPTLFGLKSFLLLEITYGTKGIGISNSNFYNRLKHVLTTWFRIQFGWPLIRKMAL